MEGMRLERLCAAIAGGAIAYHGNKGVWGDDHAGFAAFVVKRARALEAAIDEVEEAERSSEKEVEELRAALRQATNTIALAAGVPAEVGRILGIKPGETLAGAARRVVKERDEASVEPDSDTIREEAERLYPPISSTTKEEAEFRACMRVAYRRGMLREGRVVEGVPSKEPTDEHLRRCGRVPDAQTKNGRSLLAALAEAANVVVCPGCRTVLKDRFGEWPRNAWGEKNGFTLSAPADPDLVVGMLNAGRPDLIEVV